MQEGKNDPIDLQIAYWDTVGPTKPFSHPIDIDRLKSLVEPAGAMLDFGCGYGRVLERLHDRGFRHLVGVDPSAAMVAAARARVPAASVEQLTDPPHVPRPSASFDAALLVSVLTCVPTNRGQLSIVDELSRLLRPGGLLYISDLWLQTDARNRERYDAGEKAHGIYGVFDLPEGVTVRHHDRAWITKLTAGFDLVSLDDITLTTMNGHTAHGFQWIGRRR